MAFERIKKSPLAIVVLAIVLVAAGVAIYKGIPSQTKVVVKERVIEKPVTQPTTTTETTKPKPIDEVTLAIFVRDAMDKLTPIKGANVELWQVTNETAVLNSSFYTTEGYVKWLNATTDSLGKVTFTIPRVDYDIIKKANAVLYAVANATGYYKEGIKVPELQFVEGKEIQYAMIYLPKIGIPRVQTVDIDISALSQGDKAIGQISLTESPGSGYLRISAIKYSVNQSIVYGPNTTAIDAADKVVLKIYDTNKTLLKEVVIKDASDNTFNPSGTIELPKYVQIYIPKGQTLGSVSLPVEIEYTVGATKVAQNNVVNVTFIDVRGQPVASGSINILA